MQGSSRFCTYSGQASGWSTVWRSPQTPLKKGGFENVPPLFKATAYTQIPLSPIFHEIGRTSFSPLSPLWERGVGGGEGRGVQSHTQDVYKR
jgi:hypothetical protein